MSKAERLQQIRAKRASDIESRSPHRMFAGRSDDEADIDFLLEVIGGMQGEMVDLSGALEQSERQITAVRAEVSGGAFVPISEWNVTIAERDRLLDALRLILPMAKGYAHEHPVGGNQEKVNEAAEIVAKVNQ